MSDTNTGGPAFPVPGLHRDEYNNGMTLRDYFAAKAMQGLLSDTNVQGSEHDFALRAYKLADAMLKAREQ